MRLLYSFSRLTKSTNISESCIICKKGVGPLATGRRGGQWGLGPLESVCLPHKICSAVTGYVTGLASVFGQCVNVTNSVNFVQASGALGNGSVMLCCLMSCFIDKDPDQYKIEQHNTKHHTISCYPTHPGPCRPLHLRPAVVVRSGLGPGWARVGPAGSILPV